MKGDGDVGHQAQDATRRRHSTRISHYDHSVINRITSASGGFWFLVFVFLVFVLGKLGNFPGNSHLTFPKDIRPIEVFFFFNVENNTLIRKMLILHVTPQKKRHYL